MRDFRKLDIWNQTIDYTDRIYDICESFPKNEIFGITQQIKNCTVSIPSNIAEGCSRSSSKEFGRFLEIALGSSFELETQLIIAGRRKFYIDSTLIEELNIIQKRINALLKSIQK
ncbi:MAG TPA: four helix bundle protein [Saprospiraceae bacterium]|nr:four helix bundle protein [Saprospiraceae bacterium]